MILWCVLLAIVDAVRTLPTLNPVNTIAVPEVKTNGVAEFANVNFGYVSSPLFKEYIVGSSFPLDIYLYNQTAFHSNASYSTSILRGIVPVKDNAFLTIDDMFNIYKHTHTSGYSYTVSNLGQRLGGNRSIQNFVYGKFVDTIDPNKSAVYFATVDNKYTYLYKYYLRNNSFAPNMSAEYPSFADNDNTTAVRVKSVLFMTKLLVVAYSNGYIGTCQYSSSDICSGYGYTQANATTELLSTVADYNNDTQIFSILSNGNLTMNPLLATYYITTRSKTRWKVVVDTSTYKISDNNILNFGPFQYLGLAVSMVSDLSISKMFIVEKQNFNNFNVIDAPSTLDFNNSIHGLVEGDLYNGFPTFGVLIMKPGNPYYFQTYYIEFPLCATGTQSINCTACVNGTYLYQNACYAQGSFPNGTGPNTTLTLKECSLTDCLRCPTNFATCTECTPPKVYNNTSFTCVGSSCPTGCSGCSGSSCSGCIGGYSLQGSQCCLSEVNCSGYASNCNCNACGSGNSLTNTSKCCPTIPNCMVGLYDTLCGCANCTAGSVANCAAYDGICGCMSCAGGYTRYSTSKCCPDIPYCGSYNADCSCQACNSTYFTTPLADKCCLQIQGCTQYDPANCSCASCSGGKIPMLLQSVCCTPIAGCSVYYPNCSCSSCSASIPNCAQRDTTTCGCTNCDSTYTLAAGNCCADKVGCTNYASDCKCGTCGVSTYAGPNPLGSCCSQITNCVLYSSTCKCSQCGATTAPSEGGSKCCHEIANCLSYFDGSCACKNCTSANYVIYNSQCTAKNSLPEGFGADDAEFTVKPCADSRCSNCSLKYDSCVTCTAGKFMVPSSTSCVDQCPPDLQANANSICSPILDGWGKNGTLGITVLCQVNGCRRCASNYTICDQCNSTHTAITIGNNLLCFDLSTIPQGQGINISNGSIVNCSVASCTNCSANFETCSVCDTANGYLLVNGTCAKNNPSTSTSPPTQTLSKISLALKSRLFVASTRTAEITFMEETVPIQNISLLILHLLDLEEGKPYPLQPLDYSVNLTRDGFTITLNLDVTITRGELIITRVVSETEPIHTEEGKDFLDYPIVVSEIVLTKDSSVFRASSVTVSDTVRVTRVAGALALATKSPANSILLDKMIANFLYLRMIGGPAVYYPDLMLANVLEFGLVPFEVPNPIERWAQTEECSVIDTLKMKDVECNIFINYGEDIIVIYITLAVSFLLQFAPLIARNTYYKKYKQSVAILKPKKIVSHSSTLDNSELSPLSESASPNRPPLVLRSIDKMADLFGIRYFFIRLEGVQLDLAFFGLVNLALAPLNLPALITGAGLALTALTVLLYSTYSGYVLGRTAYQATSVSKMSRVDEKAPSSLTDISSPSSPVSPQEKKGKDEWTEALDFHGLRRGKYFDFYYEDQRVPTSVLIAWLPVATLIRSFGLSIAIVSLQDYAAAQITTCFVVELAYIIYSLKFTIKHSKLERWLFIVNQATYILYLLQKAVTLLDISESFRQTELGISMAVVLATNVLLNLVYVLFSVFCAVREVYALAKKYFKREKLPPTSNSSTSRTLNLEKSAIMPEEKSSLFEEKPLQIKPNKAQLNSSPLKRMTVKQGANSLTVAKVKVQSKQTTIGITISKISEPNHSSSPKKRMPNSTASRSIVVDSNINQDLVSENRLPSKQKSTEELKEYPKGRISVSRTKKSIQVLSNPKKKLM